ncbi:MAG: CDGSH iron-sulfur domain-containing protein [Sulfurospirillum sp.]|nr:CDGSH iron-sulfur domain-containing protein [Sulfurospirillum sp.]
MEKALIAGIVPAKLDTEVGKKYMYCTCGRSKNGALCDGSHAGTKLRPRAFTAQRERSVICTCKKSAEAPFCSGSHRGLSKADIGKIA